MNYGDWKKTEIASVNCNDNLLSHLKITELTGERKKKPTQTLSCNRRQRNCSEIGMSEWENNQISLLGCVLTSSLQLSTAAIE